MTKPVIMLFVWNDFIHLNSASIATMAEFTLSFLILVYFLSLRGKTQDTWLMIRLVGLIMFVFLVDIGVTTFKPPYYIYFRIGHALMFSTFTLFWTWCAYTYQGAVLLKKEAISVLLAEAILIIGLIFYLAPTAIEMSDLYLIYYALYTFHIWSILVLFRRAGISPSWVNTLGEGQDLQENLRDGTSRSLRSLAILFALWLIFVVGAFLLGSPLSYHIGQLALLLGLLILHLNYAQEETTFQVKLVSLPLATTLALLGIIPFLLFGFAPPEGNWYLNDFLVQKQLRVFAWLVPVSTVFILFSFVMFYQIGLLRPLHILLKGVRQIEGGDLKTQVPVFNRDELGHFAQCLNKMASSLNNSQEELENRVVKRTKELQLSLTQLRATQTQLIQSEKLASLGQLTAGIAHEIQNPLNFVNNFSEVSTELVDEMKEELAVGNGQLAVEIAEDIKQNLEKINYHGKRADAIVKGMLEHSRAGSGEKVPTDINALADEYLRLSYHGMRAKDKSFNAEYETHFDPDLPEVNVMPQDIGRVLLNVINNAFQAVGTGHALSLKPLVSVSTKNLGDKIEISISDNGPGIPDAIKDKIFQPFFTTKPTGQGTGLGLSLAYDIVKAHGGVLGVECKVGEFTVFTIMLPVKKDFN